MSFCWVAHPSLNSLLALAGRSISMNISWVSFQSSKLESLSRKPGGVVLDGPATLASMAWQGEASVRRLNSDELFDW